jgi:hypothetical protein
VNLGFTGTQKGMTDRQKKWVAAAVAKFAPATAHHGDCIGSDAEFHDIVATSGLPITIIIHPPTDDSKRAWCGGALVRAPKPYMERNFAIVEDCNILIAAPKGMSEERRSGTWATVRMALRANKHVIVVKPDGSLVIRTLGIPRYAAWLEAEGFDNA